MASPGLIFSTAGLAFTTFGALLADRARDGIGLTVYALSLALVPLAMAGAILRYRLYDIDRLVSRTIAYSLVTLLLVIVFGGSVVVLSGLLASVAQPQTIAIAASTIAVFVLFSPVLRRVRGSIDRRFDRARYDADRTAQAFASRLRDDTDLASVTADLSGTTGAALAPTSIGIWIRARATKA